jgi:hypothetical protein
LIPFFKSRDTAKFLRNDKFSAGFIGCPASFSAFFMRASPFSPEDRGELHFSLYNEGGWL